LRALHGPLPDGRLHPAPPLVRPDPTRFVNPWSLLSAAEYDAWMGRRVAEPLAALLGKALAARRPERLLVLGAGGGAGLEHVDPGVTRRIVAVDPNLSYLAVARQRFMRLGPALELLCATAERAALPAASFDLVHAALVLEWTDLREVVARAARWLAPGGAFTAVLDLDGSLAAAPGTAAARAVAGAARRVLPAELRREAAAAGLAERRAWVVPVAAGRVFTALFAAK
jgi:ubiquinone/menaquinone biosynthesis C-methylase UbiE